MTKNSSRFSTLVEAIIKDVKSRGYLYSGIYPDNMIEIGADLAVGIGRLTLNVEQIVCTLIQSLSFDKQVFIWSECFATRSEKEGLLNELSHRIADTLNFNLFADENITGTLCTAFTEAVLEQAVIAYNDYKHAHISDGYQRS
jgi:hypothetical protein